MDKGFYSIKNLDVLVGNRDRFTLSVPLSNKWLRQIELYEAMDVAPPTSLH